MTADEYAAESKATGMDHKRKYAGKIIELTGNVKSVKEDEKTGATVVALVAGEWQEGIKCTVRAGDWEQAAPGVQVTVRGTQVDNVLLQLEEASVVKPGANLAPKLTAADLVKELKADTSAFNKNRAGKWIYIEGEVLKSEADGRITLKGTDGSNPSCGVIGTKAKADLKGLAAGQKVKALAMVMMDNGGTDPKLNIAFFKGQ